MEWWYIHGWLNGPDFREKSFMLSFFRHNLGNNLDDAYSFLLAVRGHHPGDCCTKSWVCSSLTSRILDRSAIISKLNLDRMFLDSFLEEASTNGPPREITTIDQPPEIKSNPLAISWKDFYLGQNTSGFALSFQESTSYAPLNLQLVLDGAPSNLKKASNPGSISRLMEYMCYPRLKIVGQPSGDFISGQAWMDHQWGEHAWFLGEDQSGRVLGWDFIGFYLDDSTSVSLIIHRDTKTGEVYSQSANRMGRYGEVSNTSRFSALATRYWESPSSKTKHPLEWKIGIPGWNLEFRFEPEFENQEIPIFGLQRTIWQGSGIVKGIWKGKSFISRARGEFQGYGFIHDPDRYMAGMAERIDNHISTFFPENPDRSHVEFFLGKATWEHDEVSIRKIIADPVWELLSRKGKRWRPIFAILLLHAMGTDPEPFEALVSTLAELSHTGSLIIDDIQDSSPLRRGKESIHLLYGQEAAICAANTLYFLCSHLLFGHPELDREQQLEIHEVMMKQFTRAHFGQAQDLFWSGNLNRENLEAWLEDSLEGKILQMYELKTASPIQGLAEAASIIHRSDTSVRKASINYARSLGVAFQIIDDILNFSQSPGWRKDPAEDISEGKLTYVLFKAMEALESKDSMRLKEIISSPGLRVRPEYRNEAARLVRESGIFISCRQQALDMVEKSWSQISRLLESSYPKIMLRMMNRKLIHLDEKEYS